MKSSFLEKKEKSTLKSFLDIRIPGGIKRFDLAIENVEYLAGLCTRCLSGNHNLMFPLNIRKAEEGEIQRYIEKYSNDDESWSFFSLMCSVNRILNKYYDSNGNLKNLYDKYGKSLENR